MGNEERNAYTKNQITNALIDLLYHKNYSDINISEIVKKAQVSRNSFYRNYNTKEDILNEYLNSLLFQWKDAYDRSKKDSTQDLFISLFEHIKEYEDFYLTLKKQDLFHLFLKALLKQNGPKPEHDNPSAYITAFFTYGTFGWIEEWIARGMQEPAELLAELIAAQQK